MKKLLTRATAALDSAVRHLNELTPRPLPKSLLVLLVEIDGVLAEVKKLPMLKTGDVDALEIATRGGTLSNAERMKALRALKVVQVFDGDYRKYRKDTL